MVDSRFPHGNPPSEATSSFEDDTASHVHDAAFAGLLREAAHVSSSEFARERLTLPPGSTIGGDRFQLLRLLGHGGMGTVYEACDAERREVVALKLLSRKGAEHVYRLKNEFRAIVDVRHPNLVSLHELFADGPCWFYTMALVRGERFDRYVRPGGAMAPLRLRTCLDQLLSAVAAIHTSGKLHCDLKPSNVLVTGEGRVVVLDFGLSIDAHRGGVGQTISEHGLHGTPAYMAPEQAAAGTPRPASDLYAVGVMLFEALTGRFPFLGTSGEMIAAKQRDDPPAPSTLAADVPRDLDALCLALLARAPNDRPPLRRIVVQPATEEVLGRGFYGRADELAQLRAAYDDARRGAAVVIRIEGESGIGKTALAETFLEGLREEPGLTLLCARCYERESMPFKLFDPLIDALCRMLRRLPASEAAALVPTEAYALARLFPVLERVPSFEGVAPERMLAPQRLRERAFAALGELLKGIRARGPLVIHLDDLQWADTDSLQLLQHLLTESSGFPALLIASLRRARTTSPRLSAVFDAARDDGDVDVRTIDLGPLSEADTGALVDALLARTTLERPLRTAVVRESGGHPLFAAALAQATSAGARTSLDELLADRIAALPDGARRLLELLALSGQPVLARAALIAADAQQEDVSTLCRSQLVRMGKAHGTHGAGKTLECFHDRVREGVVRTLDDARRATHVRRLADTLKALDDESADLLRLCLVEAGDFAEAARLARQAAQVAERSFAFERAAALWSDVLSWADPSDRALRAEIGEALGNALSHAGRLAEAARAFRAAAELASGKDAQRLLRCAARDFLFAGEPEGFQLMQRTFEQAGVHMPKSASAALLELTYLRVRLKLRGLSIAPVFQPNDELLETLFTAVLFAVTHQLPVHAAVFAFRFLIAALDCGDRTHACIALGQCATHLVQVRQDGPLVDKLLARADTILARKDPTETTIPADRAHGFLAFLRGSTFFHRRQYMAARPLLQRALQFLEGEGAPGTSALQDFSRFMLAVCAFKAGDYAELARVVPPAAHESFARGCVWNGAALTGVGIIGWLVPDEPEVARRRLEEARRRWRVTSGVQIPDYWLFLGELFLLRYEGRFADAVATMQVDGLKFARAGLFARAEGEFLGHYLLGIAASSLLRSDPGTRSTELRTLVEGCIRAIKRVDKGRSADAARPLEAALLVERGDYQGALRVLRPLHHVGPQGAVDTSSRLLLHGELLGGEEGRGMVRQARAELRAQGIKNIDAFLNLGLGFCRPIMRSPQPPANMGPQAASRLEKKTSHDG